MSYLTEETIRENARIKNIIIDKIWDAPTKSKMDYLIHSNNLQHIMLQQTEIEEVGKMYRLLLFSFTTIPCIYIDYIEDLQSLSQNQLLKDYQVLQPKQFYEKYYQYLILNPDYL